MRNSQRYGLERKTAKSLRYLFPALTGEGLDELLKRIDAALPIDPIVKLSLHMPLTEGRSLALIHALGRVVHSQVNDSHMDLEAEIPAGGCAAIEAERFRGEGNIAAFALVWISRRQVHGRAFFCGASCWSCVGRLRCWRWCSIRLYGYCCLPFRIVGIAVHGVFELLRALLFLPVRVLRGPHTI